MTIAAANSHSRVIAADDPYNEPAILRRVSLTGHAYELEVSYRCTYEPGSPEYDDCPGDPDGWAEHEAWFFRRGYWVRLELTRDDEAQIERAARAEWDWRLDFDD